MKKKRLVLSCYKKLLPLLRGITSKQHNNFCFLNCLHSFARKSKLESHEKVCKKKATQKNDILEFNQYMKSDKMLYLIYVEIESLIKK